MRLPFFDRARELERLRRFLREGRGLAAVYGRRRLGKSRLIQEAIAGRPSIYYVGDARDAALQRVDLAREAGRSIPGFADVTYPDWASLLTRLVREAPAGTALAIDELPEIVRLSPDLPATLQKVVDGLHGSRGVSLVVAGSSQRMMHGLVLDSAAPLYGRAREILQLGPLPAGWIVDALRMRTARDALAHYAVWGGVPRYWELAAPFGDRDAAWAALALDPLGVLHREPDRLLADDVADIARTASILSLIGRGAHRVSEIASRVGVPATSLSHALARLLDLGLIERRVPFGRSARDTKRTTYRIADPFLRAWYRIVEPNRSRLEAGLLDVVAETTHDTLEQLEGESWEDLARQSIPRLTIAGARWDVAHRWWGPARGGPLELDIVAPAIGDAGRVLVGEAKRSATPASARAILDALRVKAERCPELEGKAVVPVLFVARPRGKMGTLPVIDAAAVVSLLR